MDCGPLVSTAIRRRHRTEITGRTARHRELRASSVAAPSRQHRIRPWRRPASSPGRPCSRASTGTERLPQRGRAPHHSARLSPQERGDRGLDPMQQSNATAAEATQHVLKMRRGVVTAAKVEAALRATSARLLEAMLAAAIAQRRAHLQSLLHLPALPRRGPCGHGAAASLRAARRPARRGGCPCDLRRARARGVNDHTGGGSSSAPNSSPP